MHDRLMKVISIRCDRGDGVSAWSVVLVATVGGSGWLAARLALKEPRWITY